MRNHDLLFSDTFGTLVPRRIPHLTNASPVAQARDATPRERAVGRVHRRLPWQRGLSTFVASHLLLTVATAHADPHKRDATTTAEALASEGETLAKRAEYSAAIEKWKAADAIMPRAKHACLIGLAYTRRELWAQAEIFFAQCRAAATAADPTPSWLAEAEQQLAKKLRGTSVAAITITVEPRSANAQLRVSSFAPDERFGPRTVHLPLGQHVISAEAPGYEPSSQTLEVRSNAAQQLTLTLQRADAGTSVHDNAGTVPSPTAAASGARNSSTSATVDANETQKNSPSAQHDQQAQSKLPWIVAGAGAAILVGGGVLHSTWLRTEYNALADANAANNPTAYDAHYDSYKNARLTTAALYGVGAATLLTGVALHYTVFAKHGGNAQVSAQLAPAGALVALTWAH